MTYLNLDTRFFDHPKTRRLVGILGRGAEVYPLKLWAYAAEYHEEDGNLSRYSDSDLEGICGWRGVKGKLVSCLIEVGFIDRDDQCTQLHNWQEHEGHIAALKERNRANAKSRWEKMRNSSTGVQHVCDTHTSRKPNEYQKDAPNLTLPNQPLPLPSKEDNKSIVIDYLAIQQSWNSFAESVGLARINSITEKRKKSIKSRLSQDGFSESAIYEKIKESRFLLGDNERGWKVDFDFVWCSPEKWVRIIEGKYNNGNNEMNGVGGANTTREDLAIYDEYKK